MLRFIKDKVGHLWFKFQWWWDGSIVGAGSVSEGLCMVLFCLFAALGSLTLAPFAIIFGIFWCIWLTIIIIKNLVADVVEWLRNKVAITLVCTLAGLLLGVFGGTTGAATGAALGFLCGVVLEMVRWTDSSLPNNKAWFGLPYDEGVHNAQQTGCGLIRVRTVEKPWIWKGFQVKQGPREDNLRRDRGAL